MQLFVPWLLAAAPDQKSGECKGTPPITIIPLLSLNKALFPGGLALGGHP